MQEGPSIRLRSHANGFTPRAFISRWLCLNCRLASSSVRAKPLFEGGAGDGGVAVLANNLMVLAALLIKRVERRRKPVH
jgi:hypothetical protein